ncbi:hypothetical protein L7F22_001322 [Adiantum nelumboides]|nr:hypothetical protein [Adiantum nelumboides]
MQGEMLMAKIAQQTANLHAVQKAEQISCDAVVSNQFKDNGYLAGQKMQLATPNDEYSGAQRLQAHSSRTGPLEGDSKVAGYGPDEDEKPKPLLFMVEGKAIDLLQLCTEVVTLGGYDKVTDNSMWSLISNRLGFGLNGGAAVKLVYAKYLKSLDTNKNMTRNGLHQNAECWGAKSLRESSLGMADCDLAGSGSTETNEENNNETPSKRRRLSYFKEDPALSVFPELKLPTPAGNSSFLGMLEWLRRLALNPGDSRKGQGPRGSKQNEAWVEECETMVMKTRSVLWGRKELIHYGGLASNMVRQKIPPAVYYKELPKPNTRTLEKLRANQTRAMKCGLHLSGEEVRSSSLYGTTPGQVLGAGSGQNIEPGLHLSSKYLKSMNEVLNIGYLLNNNATRKRIPIGAHFQAQITPRMDKAPEERERSGSDEQSCSLSTELFGGVRVWPLSDSNIAFDIVKVGRGRSLQCPCARPMSIDCVRLHVVEEKERLKKELGEAFVHWGFDDMGESVSSRWTDKEEHAFNGIVRMNPCSMGKNFWEELPTALPLKTVKELVSYYFNVFVVRRRAIENRIMPDSIDSDDDERELLASECFNTYGKNAGVDLGNRVSLMPN